MSKAYRELEEKKNALENNLKETEINLKMYQEQSVHNTSFISSVRKQLRQLTAGGGQQKLRSKAHEKQLEAQQHQEIEEEEVHTVQRYQYNTY
jgi:hypothetical protein